MRFIKPFSEISKNDADIAGGKGASLGEMTQAGIQVPPGFVILADSFEHFLTETNLLQEIDTVFHTVEHDKMHTVEKASEAIRELILHAEMPKEIAEEIQTAFKDLNTTFVAVRSSATAEDGMDHAWAGQLESYLNTTEDDVLKKVQLCWSSLFTPRAIFYRFEKGLHGTKISVAVVVQKMVQSEVSGIAFSVHPVTEDYNQLIIESGFGLGEAIVSGSVTPDSFVVEKNPRRIIDTNIAYQSKALWRAEDGGNEWRELSEPEGGKPSLTEAQVLELSEIILLIENHYGFPCDIEWAYEAGRFYITQSRPITTLAPKKEVDGLLGERSIAKYIKTYKRENCLLAFQVWEEHQTKTLEKVLNWVADPSIFDVVDGVAEVSYKDGTFDGFDTHIAVMLDKDPAFIKKTMQWYANILDSMETIWRSKRDLADKDEVLAFYTQALDAWCGLDISYEAPKMDFVSDEDKKLAMRMRERASDFLEEIDHVFQRALHALYPQLGDLIKYLRVEEVCGTNPFPSAEALKERQRHYIYYKYEVITTTPLDTFLGTHNLAIEREKVEVTDELKGQTAMGGKIQGRVRVLNKKTEIPLIQDGEILVTAMTTSDYLPAMLKAVAFVTDEGGITCHAAIMARELKKPCVINTKFATQIFKDGDLVEVNADKGVVRILDKNDH